jgi:inhibitor of cysteine peptidase
VAALADGAGRRLELKSRVPTPRAPIELRAACGEAVEIALEAFPGAGALWSAPPIPDGCRLDEGARRSGGGGIGGPALQCFAFAAARPGRYVLRFELRRPWEDEVRAVQPVSVDVR